MVEACAAAAGNAQQANKASDARSTRRMVLRNLTGGWRTGQPDATVIDLGNVSADEVSYDDLYARWEKGNWSATSIDFSEDRVEWNEKWSDLQRNAALWNYSLFFH